MQGAAEERPRCGAGLRRGRSLCLRPVPERKVIVLRERGNKRCHNVASHGSYGVRIWSEQGFTERFGLCSMTAL